jgi:hypothetical protein
MPKSQYQIANTIPAKRQARTGLDTEVQLVGFSVNHDEKNLTIKWRVITKDKTGAEIKELSKEYIQRADNSTAVILPAPGQEPVMMTTQELAAKYITPATYDDEGNQLTPAVDNTPPYMGEYDFWWYVMQNSPQPIATAIMNAGQKFAQRNGWL